MRQWFLIFFFLALFFFVLFSQIQLIFVGYMLGWNGNLTGKGNVWTKYSISFSFSIFCCCWLELNIRDYHKRLIRNVTTAANIQNNLEIGHRNSVMAIAADQRKPKIKRTKKSKLPKKSSIFLNHNQSSG